MKTENNKYTLNLAMSTLAPFILLPEHSSVTSAMTAHKIQVTAVIVSLMCMAMVVNVGVALSEGASARLQR